MQEHFKNISIDSYGKLDNYLKKKKYMVFRLGKADIGSGTAFALSRFDKKDELLSFRIIEKLTEGSFLNIALNSGIVSDALEVKGNIYSANTIQTIHLDLN